MGCLLFVLFLVVPILELYVIIQVGQEIGALPTIVILLVESIVGAAVVRREGARVWAALNDSLAAGRLPTREVTDGFLVMLGGALLLAPGFITDVVGLFLVLPVTRPIARRMVASLFGRRIRVVRMGGQAARGWQRRRRPPLRDYDIEGEVVDEGPGRQGPGAGKPPEIDRPDQNGRAG